MTVKNKKKTALISLRMPTYIKQELDIRVGLVNGEMNIDVTTSAYVLRLIKQDLEKGGFDLSHEMIEMPNPKNPFELKNWFDQREQHIKKSLKTSLKKELLAEILEEISPTLLAHQSHQEPTKKRSWLGGS